MLDAVMIAFLFLDALCVVLVLADEIGASLSRLRARGREAKVDAWPLIFWNNFSRRGWYLFCRANCGSLGLDSGNRAAGESLADPGPNIAQDQNKPAVDCFGYLSSHAAVSPRLCTERRLGLRQPKPKCVATTTDASKSARENIF
jgi:hypothetical protein